MHSHSLSCRRSSDHPFGPLQREMSRVFGDFFTLPSALGSSWDSADGYLPRLEVEDTGQELRVSAELPGLEEKDIQLSVHEGTLVLQGEKRQESERKDGSLYHSERSYGSFQRVLQLPADVDASAARAEFKNGVLRITLPKSAKAQPQRIEIKGA